jgi:dipeptidyl aminopeptidase/acylaminoacyl peptidase
VARNPLLLQKSQNGKISYFIPDLSGRRPPGAIEMGPDDTLLAAAPDGTALVANASRASTDILLKRGPRRQPLIRLNAFLDDVDLGQRREISYRAPSGQALTGCVMLPPGYVEGKHYPTIVITYPGLPGRCPPASVNFFSDEELLAAHGYVVLRPGNPVETIRTAEGPIAGMPAVVESAINAAVAGGYADPERLGLWGVSQGGWSSLWLATQMKQFKAVVSAQGWSDLPSHYLGADHQELLFPQDMPYAMNTVRYDPPAGSEQSIGKTLWEAPQIYVNNSSTMHVDKVTAPVMLIASDMDIFPLWQYQEMYTGLYRLRKPACLVVYMGEGHWPQSPANLRDLWARAFAWFDFHLQHAQSNGCAEPGSLNEQKG